MTGDATFGGTALPNMTGHSAPTAMRVGRGATPYRHGGRAGARSYTEGREVKVEGMLVAIAGQSWDDVYLTYQQLVSTMVTAGEQRLLVRDNWFLNAVCEGLVDTDRQHGFVEYEATFWCADPRYHKVGPNADGSLDQETTATVTSGVAFTVAGDFPPLARLTLTPSGTGSPLTITHSSGKSLLWTPAAAGAVVVSPWLRKVTRSGTDVTSEFDGEFFEVNAGANTITVTGGTMTSMSLTYREAQV